MNRDHEPLAKKISLNVVIFMVALLAAGAMIPSRFAVTLTPSLEKRVFLITDRNPSAGVENGDYVMFSMSRVLERNQTLRELFRKKLGPVEDVPLVIKRVSCLEGQDLRQDGRSYFCNGRFIGTARERSSSGDPLEQFEYNGKVPAGYVFVTGDHNDSCDSRYFGFVSVGDIHAKVHALF
ncbi:MAG: signal peptidase I [Syntrophales bacterium]